MRRTTMYLWVLTSLSCIPCAEAQDAFYAYHTKVSHTSTDYFGKYADIIVHLGEGSQLEFTRRTNYVPRWVTPSGSFPVDEFFPERELDHSFEYNYVRLLETSPDQIVVHWRYVPDLKIMRQANEALDPTFMDGFTNVVHEYYTIYPDGRVDRLVKDARSSTFDAWLEEDYGHRQQLWLNEKGIEHGKVVWGSREASSRATEGNPLVARMGLPEPALSFRFDEGMGEVPEWFLEEEEELEANLAVEYMSEDLAEIDGHGSIYKKGVSGTALGFDGYYTGVHFEDAPEAENISMEAWIALDVYPFNNAPVLHRSTGFGQQGYYLGIDPYGHCFIRVNGAEVCTEAILPLYTWTHVAATLGEGKVMLYVDGQKVGETIVEGAIQLEDAPLSIGMNNEKERCTDYVRGHDQNIPFIYGVQGLIDEVRLYEGRLSAEQVADAYRLYLPDDRSSDLAPAVLPGEVGVGEEFGAYYKTLEHHELWDRMWRLGDHADIVVKFDHNPASVVYWHGTNYAANWVTDNNRWMADQSSEIFTTHGCSEHMADKQTRHSYARIIENNEARVIVHWRYPCVDVGYICTDRMNWTDEYHTIYPDGTGIRKVVFNNAARGAPGFQDIQFFTNPGEAAMDVVHMNAMTVANTKGDILELEWALPNKNPEQKLEDATIEWLNSKSEYKVFSIFQGGRITTWGSFEQSAYTEDPFAGPWNHWPISLVPSDGRYAVAHDRVTHFALGANDEAPEFGAMVQYGFTRQTIESVIPLARYWQEPPEVTALEGAEFKGFLKEEKAFHFRKKGGPMSFTIEASEASPVVNPCIVVQNASASLPSVIVNGKEISPEDMKIGMERDSHGAVKQVIWMEMQSEEEVSIEIR